MSEQDSGSTDFHDQVVGAAAYVETRGGSLDAYRELFTTRRAELWARAQPPDAYHAIITTTWELAFAYARQTPGAAALLNLCCFLAPEGIPLELIVAAAEEPAHEALAPLADPLAWGDALAACCTPRATTPPPAPISSGPWPFLRKN